MAGPLNPGGQSLFLVGHLSLDRCPHCGIAQPLLQQAGQGLVTPQAPRRWWAMYICTTCGGVLLAASNIGETGRVCEYYPSTEILDPNIPVRARDFLKQAQESIAQPSGAVMLCASAVDAMLKGKGLKEGSLYTRINQAATDHLITDGMKQWAHQVRLDANGPRHSDEDVPMPTMEDAKRSVAFTVALAEFLFVLPAKVTRGIKDTKTR